MKNFSHPVPPPVSGLAAALRERGVSATPQRVAVFQALASCLDHPTPEALHGRLARRMPTLSLGTVYKTLHLLAGLGLAQEVSVAGENARRFDANVGPHHHLICERCHRVEDHADPAWDRRLPDPRAVGGFRPRRIAVQVLGLCAACAAPARGGARRPAPGSA